MKPEIPISNMNGVQKLTWMADQVIYINRSNILRNLEQLYPKITIHDQHLILKSYQ